MKFFADLHVHSRFSRATAKNLDLENLYIFAQVKGITVVGTGDFTHPGWFSEIRDKLIPAEQGLFRLRDDIAQSCDTQVPDACRQPVRFILQCEISNIYKKGGKTRKNHNILYLPDMETALRLSSKLGAIGNIKSDGRPILGLDSKRLLEMLLDVSDQSMLIPAHIWTPWFSVLGSKSGFDSLEDCFEDLLPYITAAETGLSSDPPMNWRVSHLDRVTLVSNSDAHSPANLGRNANWFDTDLSYAAIRSALKTGDPTHCLGTIDLYPEEGKYHYDGHRLCGIRLHPSDTMKYRGLCPKCGKPLTLGVLYRVEELADRPEGFKPATALPCYHIIPLAEILSEIFSVGSSSQKVSEFYRKAIQKLGSELDMLLTCPEQSIETVGIPLLAEAICRMRTGKVHLLPGFDGEYGKITLFELDERETLLGKQALFAIPSASKPLIKDTRLSHRCKTNTSLMRDVTWRGEDDEDTPDINDKKGDSLIGSLNAPQREAVQHQGSPLLIVAGPGAGKTRTLTHRIAWLIRERRISPDSILAVTFTNKAANEMTERLRSLLNSFSEILPTTATFHSLCYNILKEQGYSDYTVIDDDTREALIAEAADQVRHRFKSEGTLKELSDRITAAKQHLQEPSDPVHHIYQKLLMREKLWDYEDLILHVVKLLESNPAVLEQYQQRFQYLFVDEYQDLNEGQYRIVKALSRPDRELCVIGDPDQAIYGFRGADVKYFQNFIQDFPNCRIIRLTQNYRSTESILEASWQVIRNHRMGSSDVRVYSGIQGIETLTIVESASEKAEAVAVGKWIERMVGGVGFHSIDFGKTDETGIRTDRAFSDFAVLYRTSAQSAVIAEVFEAAGIPFQIARKEHVFGRKGIAELLALMKLCEHCGVFNDVKRLANAAGFTLNRNTLQTFRNWHCQQSFSLSEAFQQIKRFPVPGMSPADQRHLCAWVDNMAMLQRYLEGKSVSDKLWYLKTHTSMGAMIDTSAKTQEIFNKLVNTAAAYGNDLAGFLEMLTFQTDADTAESRAQSVTLMTLHAAKGLEFPVVFITGCENDLIPLKYSEDAPIHYDEERRLLYVGMTRAKDRLVLTYARKRTIYGKTRERELSPFVRDIEERLITLKKSQVKKPTNKPSAQIELFST